MKYCDTSPEGFLFYPEFISEKEEAFLLKQLQGYSWQRVVMHGVTAKRRVLHFGLDYSYTTRSTFPTIEIPDFLTIIRHRVAQLLEVDSNDIIEVLVTEYPSGAGIGWHRDAPIFGNKIFGISLLGTCVMKLRHIDDHKIVYKKELSPRSGYIISHQARTKWQHSIPPVKEKRYSLTFRISK